MVLARKLEWVPGCSSWGEAKGPTLALELCRHGSRERGGEGEYRVQHYSRATCGRAFGPLGLVSLMRFCRGLEVRLARLEAGKRLVLSTPPGDEEYRSNAAVLLGAYLLLRHQWTTARVTACLGAREANAMFACAWAPADKPEEPRALRVQDCWSGIELAKKQGWLGRAFIQDDCALEELCRGYQSQLTRYDATWLVPGRLMVAADPMTVLYDPNPATIDNLFPKEEIVKLGTKDDHWMSESTASDIRDSADGSVHGVSSWSSSDTIYEASEECEDCSAQGQNGRGSATAKDCPEEDRRDLATFLQQSGVGLILRANRKSKSESSSYTDHCFEPYGIWQANIRAANGHKSLPGPSEVARALAASEGFAEGGADDAVLLHCEGGFGRSMVLACLLAIHRFDIPGRALMGWARIARPGAFTTHAEEALLASLGGRADVFRYANIPHTVDETKAGVKLTCHGPCHIQ